MPSSVLISGDLILSKMSLCGKANLSLLQNHPIIFENVSLIRHSSIIKRSIKNRFSYEDVDDT